MRKRWRTSLRDVKTYPGLDRESDHYTLIAEVYIKLRSFPRTPKRPNIWDLKNNNKFIESASEELERIDAEEIRPISAEELWNRMEAIMEVPKREFKKLNNTPLKVRSLTKATKPRILTIKAKNGEKLTSKSDVIERWKTYCQELMADDSTDSHSHNIEATKELEPPILKQEEENSVQRHSEKKQQGGEPSTSGHQASRNYGPLHARPKENNACPWQACSCWLGRKFEGRSPLMQKEVQAGDQTIQGRLLETLLDDIYRDVWGQAYCLVIGPEFFLRGPLTQWPLWNVETLNAPQVTEEETMAAVAKIADRKAPGLDGIPPEVQVDRCKGPGLGGGHTHSHPVGAIVSCRLEARSASPDHKGWKEDLHA
ncbi:hypothetical protein HHI36_018507 [Cryptolaemus montrouzieri]|uniref:Uncharacterized protein n=1 Tax=Cryptolaemus montrouzieri TaxID=559131 RepID=A0ABD2P0B0_9CUCU